MPNDDNTDRESDRTHEHASHPETADYPELLLITAAPLDVAFERGYRLVDRSEDGTKSLHLLTFGNPTRIGELLTERRLEALQGIDDASPPSIRDLSDRLGRAASGIHEDVHLLAEYNIVRFKQDGRAPYIPYEHMAIEIDMLGTDVGTDRALASD